MAQSHRTKHLLVQAIAVLTSAALVLLAFDNEAGATGLTTQLTTESFTAANTTNGNWTVPPAQASYSNLACMTAGTDTAQSPIPACWTTALDPAGGGALRLTNNAASQVGSVYNTVSLPGSQGLDISFDSYQYDGSGADGIAFILAATDPADPQPPAVDGPFGGSLGYSAQGSNGLPGVSYGYLGFGLDVYGNFENAGFGGPACPATTKVPESVTVRGPGNGLGGYCIISTAPLSSGALDRTSTGGRPPTPVPVEIAVNPGATPATSSSGLAVAAKSFAVEFTPLGGSTQTVTGTLPDAATLQGLGFPSDWYDPSTGVPYQLTFGWAASTGGSNEYHEINQLKTSSLNGQVPVYGLSTSDNEGGHLLAGGTAEITVTPAVASTEGAETAPLTVTTTLPTGLTPGTATGTGYSCTTSGQSVTCSYDPGGTPVAAGTSLPLKIPVTVTSSAPTSVTVTAKVSSNDSLPATASTPLTVDSFSASANPTSTTHGSAVTLSAGLPAAATGDVVFKHGTTVLCTASAPSYSCTTPALLDVGSYPVTATLDDPAYGTMSATTSFTVGKASTAFTASAGAATPPYGTADTLSTTGLPADATGTVTLTSGGATLCTITLPATSCTTSGTLPPGAYSVTAGYPGDANHLGSTATTSFVVSKGAASGLAASATPSSAEYGSAVTLGFSGLPADATGSVTFTSGGSTLCTVPDMTAAASCTTSRGLAVATYPVTAAYSGDANYGVGSADTDFAVAKAGSPLFSAAVAKRSVEYGTSDTLSFSGLVGGASGSVTFTSGATTLCTVPDVTTASSCRTATSLAAGAHHVTATYSGDSEHAGQTADTALTVSAAAVVATAQARTHSIAQGQSQTLSIAGLPAAASGTVTFSADGRTLCTVQLPATACKPTTLAAGDYHVIATYSGDENHAATTAVVSFTVTAAPRASSTASTPAGATMTIDVPAGATRITISRSPAHGSVKLVNGALAYTPAKGFTGTDTVTMRIVHADGSISYQTVHLLIRAASRSGSAGLADTGASIRTPLLLAAALLGTGAAILTVVRRPRSARVTRHRH